MEISRVEAQSKRIQQTFAWGMVVWHVWGTTECADEAAKEAAIEAAENTHTDIVGPTSPRPLVLLHGGSGSWTHWVRNVEHFAQTRPVWALDIPGFGESDLPKGVSDADGLVSYVAEILTRSFQGEAIDVMGFSFGGMTAGLVAAQYPKIIRQLILVGAPGLGLFDKVLPMRGMTTHMDLAELRSVHRHNLNAMMLAHAESVTNETIDLQESNVDRDRLRRRRIARTDVLAKVQTQWTCPVHGVWGELDALYKRTLQQVPTVLPKLATFTVVPDARHWLMYERPDAFHTAVDPLLIP
jgi:pimeloyl-ACP methyl ester carboxylesterase